MIVINGSFIGTNSLPSLIAHEFAHVVQWNYWGYAAFAAKYGAWLIQYGYRANPFEAGARDFAAELYGHSAPYAY
jgi:uncharacterized protein YjaZ